MLVLSRRLHEKIVFPGFHATVEVVGVKSNCVRLGIDAPPDVKVLREEVLALAGVADEPGSCRHPIPNRLNTLTVGLALLRRQLHLGLASAQEATLDRLEQEAQALRQSVERPGQARATPRPSRPSRRALLVEDDPNQCELLAGFLRVAGLEVATAGDGADALEYLRTQGRPDVVLLDMLLPRCDGPTTVRAIRGDPANAGLRVYGVSGHTPDSFALPEGPGGVDGWFRKPLDPEALLRHLDRVLETAL